MKKRLFFALPLLALGIALASYPFVSNWKYQQRTDKVIAAYSTTMESKDAASLQAELEAARCYNEELASSEVALTDPFEATTVQGESDYNSLLNLDSSGLMSYVEIPKIDVYLPVYHGTGSAVLEQGVGHLEGTSLPIGGQNTRAVLTGHSGLNSAKLFTDLSELKKGDLFFLHTLQQTLAYRVSRIEVVLPTEANLSIVEGKDLCTLITCTPLGINTHRLMVTGERTEYTEDLHTTALEEPEAPSQWMQEYRQALCVSLLLSAIITVVTIIIRRRVRRG